MLLTNGSLFLHSRACPPALCHESQNYEALCSVKRQQPHNIVLKSLQIPEWNISVVHHKSALHT